MFVVLGCPQHIGQAEVLVQLIRRWRLIVLRPNSLQLPHRVLWLQSSTLMPRMESKQKPLQIRPLQDHFQSSCGRDGPRVTLGLLVSIDAILIDQNEPWAMPRKP